MMTRRGFFAGILGAIVAPIVSPTARAEPLRTLPWTEYVLDPAVSVVDVAIVDIESRDPDRWVFELDRKARAKLG